MRTTIDAAGRIVVPKVLRDEPGLAPGQGLEIRRDGRLDIQVAPRSIQLEKRGKGIVAIPGAEFPSLTADRVRETLERVRPVKAADTSLVVAAFASWHGHHESARRLPDTVLRLADSARSKHAR